MGGECAFAALANAHSVRWKQTFTAGHPRSREQRLLEQWDGTHLCKTRKLRPVQATGPTSSTSHSIQLVGQKGGRGRLIGRTKGGMNTKLHAVTDTIGRPIRLFMTAGQVSDYTGVRALVSSLPAVDWPLGARGHDADWFRADRANMGITPCNPGRKSREKTRKI